MRTLQEIALKEKDLSRGTPELGNGSNSFRAAEIAENRSIACWRDSDVGGILNAAQPRGSSRWLQADWFR